LYDNDIVEEEAIFAWFDRGVCLILKFLLLSCYLEL